MASQVIWRLEEGYSRFVEGSRVELRLRQGPLKESLKISPKGLADRSEPIEWLFQAARSFAVKDVAGLAWRLRPEAVIRARILFAGNAFLGNFRVPSHHFAVQWDLEAQVEGSVRKTGPSLLVELEGQSRLYQSWVLLVPDGTPPIQALHQAWGSYRSPLDADEVLQMQDGQVVRWRWNGRLRLGMGIEWSLAAGWNLPGTLPWMVLQKELFVGAALGARFQVTEEGEFSLQLRKRPSGTEFRLRKIRERRRESGFSAGVELGSQLRVSRLGPSSEGVLGLVSQGLGQPLSRKVNRGLGRALTRSLEISLAVERSRWKRQAALLNASWSRVGPELFRRDYSRLLKGSLPVPDRGVRFSGSFERIRGRRFTVRLSLLNWAGMEKSTEHQERQTVRIGPAGDLVLENTREFQKARHSWDEVQFLRLLDRETFTKEGRRRDFLWSHGLEKEFSYVELLQLLKLSVRMGVINQFDLAPRSQFPLTAQLLVVTRFSPEGLTRVRRAGRRRQWEALVRALEMADPGRYAEPTFWRDWIDSPELRRRVDRDPVQTYLTSRYPLSGRSTFQRQQVVAAYRRAKRLGDILQHWKAGDHDQIIKAFSVGLDLPIFVFFHLLCPEEFRDSGVLMTGGVEQVWGNEELLEEAE
ncbi:MAG: hypothetical protein V3R94_11115 [Acidobacteriota bacterium]